MPKKKRTSKAERPAVEEALAEEGQGSLVEEEVEEAIPAFTISVPPPVEPYKKIRYLGTVHIFKIKGPVTGIQYAFDAKDRVSFVATEDYEGLLNKVRPARRCCGKRTIPAQPYFGPVE